MKILKKVSKAEMDKAMEIAAKSAYSACSDD